MVSNRARGASAAPKAAVAEGAGDMDDIFVVDTTGDNAGSATGEEGKKKKKQKKKQLKGDKAKAGEAKAAATTHEAEWERILFGSSANDVEDSENRGGDDAEATFPLVTRGGGESEEEVQEEPEPAAATTRRGPWEKTAAWHDDDDSAISVDLAGKDRLRKLRKEEDETAVSGVEYAERIREHANKSQAVNWATRKKMKGEEREGDGILHSGARLTSKHGAMLPVAALEVERLRDANYQDLSDAVVQSARFHPNNQLMLTASLDKRLKLFQIDGKSNSKVQGVHFEDLPIQCAEFSAGGDEVLVSGRRKFFYVYNLAGATVSKVQGVLGSTDKFLGAMLPSTDGQYVAVLGTCGHIGLLSGRSKQWIGEVRMNCDVTCAVFSRDGHSMYSAGKSASVYQWDLRMRRCVKKIYDDGSLHISSLALSAGNIMAVGSKTGVVNTYDMNAWHSLPLDDFGEIRPSPRRALMNLTTGISLLNFNSDGQMLLMASQAKKEALRIVHTSTSTVFPNWPTAGTPLHSVSCADFSPNNRFLAIGNDRGKVLLYRLKHYQ